MLEYYAPEIVLPSDVIVSLQIEHSTFRLGISSKINKLLSQMKILFLEFLFNVLFNFENAVAYIHLYGSDPKRDPNHSLFINPIDPHRMRLILHQPQPGPKGSVGRDESSWDDLRNSSSSGRDGTRTRYISNFGDEDSIIDSLHFFKACKILNLIWLSAWLSLDTLGLFILFSVTFVP